MQPVLTTEQSREFDRYLTQEIGIPSLVLMENAAQGVLEAMEDWLDELHEPEIAVFCGRGNNGGDGFAVARLLLERERNVTVFLCGDTNKLAKDAKAQYDILSTLLDPDEVYAVESSEEILEITDSPDIIIDALLGTGSTGEPRGAIREAIDAIAMLAPAAKVIAIDIPSGIDSDNGSHAASNASVHADRTVTMGAPKIGFFQGNSRHYTGDILVAQLGGPYPDSITNASGAFLVDRDDVAPLLPEFEETCSKIERGRVLALCGSRGMTGAAVMSGMAALKSGCGMVTVAIPESERAIIAHAMPELLTLGLTSETNGSPDYPAWEQIKSQLTKSDAMLAGCGIPVILGTTALMHKIVSEVELPLVLDAGALGALAGHLDLVASRKSPSVLTPHTGEIARLVGRTWQEVERDRLNTAREVAMQCSAVIVMKGAPTYTVAPDGTAYINTTGNVGMATAGTGDVLAGMIASLLAQTKGNALHAAIAAVYLHGLAGDFAAKELTTHSMTATDIITMLPKAFQEMGVE